MKMNQASYTSFIGCCCVPLRIIVQNSSQLILPSCGHQEIDIITCTSTTNTTTDQLCTKFTLSLSTSDMISLILSKSPIPCSTMAVSSSSLVMNLSTMVSRKENAKFQQSSTRTHDSPTVVLIEILKSFIQVLVPFQSMPMHCGRYELDVVDRSISIDISLKKRQFIFVVQPNTQIKCNSVSDLLLHP